MFQISEYERKILQESSTALLHSRHAITWSAIEICVWTSTCLVIAALQAVALHWPAHILHVLS